MRLVVQDDHAEWECEQEFHDMAADEAEPSRHEDRLKPPAVHTPCVPHAPPLLLSELGVSPGRGRWLELWLVWCDGRRVQRRSEASARQTMCQPQAQSQEDDAESG